MPILSVPVRYAKPDDFVFTTPSGTPIDEDNFQSRIWLPTLRRLGIRERPFYNTRHSYISYMISIGKKVAFVSEQTGVSIKTIEKHYKKYFPAESDMEIPGEENPLLPGEKPGGQSDESAKRIAS